MKRFFLVILCSTSLCQMPLLFSQSKAAKGDPFIPAFDLKPNDLELSRPAQPNQYFDKIGPRAGLMGTESGRFEMWVWPWKPLRDFELQFLLGTSTQAIPGGEIVRTIAVTPEVTTLTYTHEAFTVKEHIFIPRGEPGAILLLDVHTTTPLSIVPGFIPVMQPMWPAGIGGQFSYWDDDANAYVISEGQWRAVFLCGSPAGKPMAAPPAHMLADNPLQFRIDVKPGESDGRFIPVVIAGAMPDTATGKMKYDSVKATYARLWKDAGKYYNGCYEYFRALRTSTMQLTTPDTDVNLAYEWGKVALDNLIIDNPRLGHGMVAGFGLSGSGARPGFAWFFGGDAFINVLALNSVGMFGQARDALAFTQKWQRQENFPVRKTHPSDPPRDVGKMAHELSQSDGLCDWWNDYHYGYNHADTSPWYIVAMGDYVRTSGDTTFLRQSWNSVKQAYAWCLSKDSDGDGLMDLKGAGLGALEFGKLVGIYADIYTCGVFVQAVKEMKYMAELVGDSAQARQADAQFRKAQPRMEKLFWLEKEGYYAYGATDKGEQVKEKTPWAGVAMMFGLLDEQRTAKALEAMNSADLCTDWGVRTLSHESALFEPTNYNYGAVWPFISSFFNTAQFRHHYALSGFRVLQSNIRHVFDHALGSVPEVFSGELNEKLGEGYHHQGFSTTGYMLPLVRGYLGLETDAAKKLIDFRPHLGQSSGPGEKYVLRTIALGADTADLDYAGDLMVAGCRGPDSIRVRFSRSGFPSEQFEPLAGLQDVNSGTPAGAGEVWHRDDRTTRLDADLKVGIDAHLSMEFAVKGGDVMIHTGVHGFSIGYPGAPGGNSVGQTNRGLKIVSHRLEGKTLRLALEGVAGSVSRLRILESPGPMTAPRHMTAVVGADLDRRAGELIVSFPPKSKAVFVPKEIVITLE